MTFGIFEKIKILIFLLFASLSVSLYAQSDVNIIGKADSPVYTVSWSPNGSLFATSGNNFVIIWYADTNTTKTFYVEHGVPVISSEFSRDGKWFLSVGSDSSVIVRNIENQASPTKILGKKDFPIKDAAFISDNGFSVAIPVDGRTLTCFFRLMASQEFVQRKILEAFSSIYSIDVNYNGTRILLGTEDGKAVVIDANSGEIVQEVPRFADSNIRPTFSPDGKQFVAASDMANLVISYTNQVGSRIIRDPDFFVNAVAWSPDGKKLACATQSGSVKIYDSESCKYEKSIYLVDGNDVVVSMQYSPDGEFLLAGTKNGFIYRWSLTGKIFDTNKKEYVDPNSTQAQSAIDSHGAVPELRELIEALRNGNNAASQQNTPSSPSASSSPSSSNASSNAKKNTPANTPEYSDSPYKHGHSLIIETGISVPPDPYTLSASLAVGYANYNLIQPFYFGGFVKPSLAFALGNYPYSYTLNGSSLASPKLASFKFYAPLGFVFYPFYDAVEVYSEVCLGLSLHTLWNGKIGVTSVSTGVYPSFYSAVRVGGGWRFLRFNVSGEYDVALGFTFSLGLGFNINLGKSQ